MLLILDLHFTLMLLLMAVEKAGRIFDPAIIIIIIIIIIMMINDLIKINLHSSILLLLVS